jgi:hypothetical protein
MALSESPHWAFAVALNATISTANAATLTPLIRWIILDIPTPLSLSAKFCRFMSSSFATSFSPLRLNRPLRWPAISINMAAFCSGHISLRDVVSPHKLSSKALKSPLRRRKSL